MISYDSTSNPAHPASSIANWVWLAVAVTACLYVDILNGGPLYYFDTGGYFGNGMKVLRTLGWVATPEGHGLGQGGGDDGIVNGSRSVTYSVFAAIFGMLLSPQTIPPIHTALLLTSVWLAVRVPLRACDIALSTAKVMALSVVAAAFGSMSFYIAFVMPDLMSAVLILLAALVGTFGRKMRGWELALAIAVSAFAVLAHPSHLLLAAGLLVLTLVSAPLIARRRWWLAPVFMVLVLGVGLGEQAAIRVAAKEKLNAQVQVYPFLTARLIQDRVGYRYLSEICPDPEFATCALYEKLRQSDNPMRLTATHIIFESDPELGSFRLMQPKQQLAIAGEQIEFAKRTAMAHPVATARAILTNTLLQAQMASIQMTIPTEASMRNLQGMAGLEAGSLSGGRLAESRDWIPSADHFQNAVYLLSLVVVVALLFWPGRLDLRFRLFAAIILLGILGNALICGAVSQPADRYGARVIWLLPYLAAFLTLVGFAPRRKAPRQA